MQQPTLKLTLEEIAKFVCTTLFMQINLFCMTHQMRYFEVYQRLPSQVIHHCMFYSYKLYDLWEFFVILNSPQADNYPICVII